jgi:hypothetical protein
VRTQRVLLGEMVIDREPPIELYVELPRAEVGKKSATLKERLAFLLDTRFRPASPESPKSSSLTVQEVADLLHCRCRTVLRMIRGGQLHPFSEEDGELYFDRAEVESIRSVPVSSKLFRLVRGIG